MSSLGEMCRGVPESAKLESPVVPFKVGFTKRSSLKSVKLESLGVELAPNGVPGVD